MASRQPKALSGGVDGDGSSTLERKINAGSQVHGTIVSLSARNASRRITFYSNAWISEASAICFGIGRLRDEPRLLAPAENRRFFKGS